MDRRTFLSLPAVAALIPTFGQAAEPDRPAPELVFPEGCDPDLHFAADGRGQRRVYVDGKEVEDVESAHPREGWIIKYYTRPDGSFAFAGDDVLRVKIHGEVRVEFTGRPIPEATA